MPLSGKDLSTPGQSMKEGIELQDINLDLDLDLDHAGEQTTDAGEEPTAALIAKCRGLKAFLMFLIYLFWLGTLFGFITFVPFLHEINEEDEIKTYLEMSEHEAFAMMGTWYLAIFGFGWIVLNFIRIVIMAKFGPSQATKIKLVFDALELEQPGKIHEQTVPNNFFTMILIPKESVEVALDILFM
jgi:hypothetical protein